MAKDDDSDIDGAEDGELVSLLEQAAFTLEESNRSVPVVLNGLDLDLSSSHSGRCNLYEPRVVGSGA